MQPRLWDVWIAAPEVYGQLWIQTGSRKGKPAKERTLLLFLFFSSDSPPLLCELNHWKPTISQSYRHVRMVISKRMRCSKEWKKVSSRCSGLGGFGHHSHPRTFYTTDRKLCLSCFIWECFVLKSTSQLLLWSQNAVNNPNCCITNGCMKWTLE